MSEKFSDESLDEELDEEGGIGRLFAELLCAGRDLQKTDYQGAALERARERVIAAALAINVASETGPNRDQTDALMARHESRRARGK